MMYALRAGTTISPGCMDRYKTAMDDPLSHPLEASDKKKQSNEVWFAWVVFRLPRQLLRVCMLCVRSSVFDVSLRVVRMNR